MDFLWFSMIFCASWSPAPPGIGFCGSLSFGANGALVVQPCQTSPRCRCMLIRTCMWIEALHDFTTLCLTLLHHISKSEVIHVEECASAKCLTVSYSVLQMERILALSQFVFPLGSDFSCTTFVVKLDLTCRHYSRCAPTSPKWPMRPESQRSASCFGCDIFRICGRIFGRIIGMNLMKLTADHLRIWQVWQVQ